MEAPKKKTQDKVINIMGEMNLKATQGMKY